MPEGFVESKKVVKTQDGLDRGEETSTLGPCESDHFTWSFQFEFMLTLQLIGYPKSFWDQYISRLLHFHQLMKGFWGNMAYKPDFKFW